MSETEIVPLRRSSVHERLNKFVCDKGPLRETKQVRL